MNKIYHLYFFAWPTNKSTEMKSSFNPGCVIGTECEVLQNDRCYTIIYKEHSNRQYNQLLCFYWCTRMYFGALPYQGHKFEARVCNREKNARSPEKWTWLPQNYTTTNFDGSQQHVPLKQRVRSRVNSPWCTSYGLRWLTLLDGRI